jgi:hypothetical protein
VNDNDRSSRMGREEAVMEYIADWPRGSLRTKYVITARHSLAEF